MGVRSRIDLGSDVLGERVDVDQLLMLVFLLPIFAFFVVIWFIPIVYGLGMSFFVDPGQNPVFTGFANYAELVASPDFWNALWNSTVYAVSTTFATLVVGLGLALAVNQRIRGGAAVRTAMILPYLIPMIVGVFMWRFLLSPNIGIVNQVLGQAGLIAEPIRFFNSMQLAMGSVVTISVWKFGSFAFFVLLARLQAIDEALYERARMEGATPWQVFRDITLPNLRAAILIIILVRSIWLFNTFDVIWLSTGGGPLESTTTLPIRIYEIAFFNGNLGGAAAVAGIMFLLLTGVAIVYFTIFSPAEEVTS